MSHDPRSVLGLPASASARDVRRAFRRLVLELHPDRHHGDAQHAARLRSVVEAYEALTGKGRPTPRATHARPPRPRREAPPPPRIRERFACPCCLDTFAYDATCSRCEVPLVDELRSGTVTPASDSRVDAMVAELERRGTDPGAWARKVAPRVPIAAISSLLAGGAFAVPIHAPVAAMLIGYALFLLGAEAIAPRADLAG